VSSVFNLYKKHLFIYFFYRRQFNEQVRTMMNKLFEDLDAHLRTFVDVAFRTEAS
jgi:hypothetical protein